MAKQIGTIKLKGKIGGISFYMLNGEPVARQAGGFTREAIKNSPRMDRIRDNNTEFGDASSVKKIFKDSLRPFFGSQRDRMLQSRMQSLFMQLKDCDLISERGSRRVGIGLQTQEGKQLMTQFDFTPHSLRLRKSTYDASTLTYTVDGFDSGELNYRNGATHLELFYAVVVIDFGAKKAKLFAADTVVITKASLMNGFTLSPAVQPEGNGTYITVLLHRYLQEVNGTLYPLKDKAVYGMRVLGVL